MTSKTLSNEKHVAVFVFPFTSHPLAHFNLSCKLANAAPDVQFSLFSTERSNRAILSTKRRTIHDLPNNMKTYNFEEGMPDGHEWSETMETMRLFRKVVPENFRPCMEAAVNESGRRITFLLTDHLFASVVATLSTKMRVPWASFFIPAPVWLCPFIYVDLVAREYFSGGAEKMDNKTIDCVPGLSTIRYEDITPDILSKPANLLFMTENAKALSQASALVLNSYEELSPAPLISDFKSKFQNVLNVGLMTISSPLESLILTTKYDGYDDPTGCLSWLKRQKPSSVAYISFGIFAALSTDEVVALAEALEETGVPFLWSLKDNFKDILPNGFVDRLAAQGKVVPWAPQNQVLAHPSTGVHVTHCGYNSVIESILAGVPIIGRPFWADNHMNGRMVEETWKIGVRVKGGVLTKTEVLNCLNIVLKHEKGKVMKENIIYLKETILKAVGSNGSATKDFNKLVQIISKG